MFFHTTTLRGASHLVCAVLLIVSFLAPASTFSQQSSSQLSPTTRINASPWSVGILGGAARLSHTARFDILLEKPECCSYERGTAWSYSGGLFGEFSFVPNTLSVSLRTMFAARPLELSEDVSSRLDGRPIEYFTGSEYLPLSRRYTYRSAAQFLVGDLGLTLRPFADVPMYARLSGEIATPLGNMRPARYTSQILPSPNASRYPNNSDILDSLREAAVPLRTVSFAAVGAVGVEIPLEQRLLLGFEASYRYGIGSIRQDAVQWRTDALQASLGLRWKFMEEVLQEETASPNTPNDTATTQAPLVIEALSGKPLELQETVVTQTFPLLPYIFFDSASVVVKSRYNPRIGLPSQFDETALPKETMQIYYHILHIVGKRMKSNPAAILTITGTTDGKEWATTDQRQILALQRARTVASFLTGFWGISERRIKLATRDTPTLPSNSRYNEGDEENRRVELTANQPEILAPVVHSQFLEFTPLQEQQVVAVKLLHPEEADGYEGRLEAVPAQVVTRPLKQSTTDTLALTKGTGAPPERLPFSLGRKFSAKLLQYGTTLEDVRCRLEVAQRNGSVVRGETRLPVRLTKNQYEISRLNLIVFDFDRDDMRATNEVMLRRFTQEAIKPASEVRITGSTDRLGELRYNQELSESRAKAVQEVMRRVNARIRFVSVRGTGASSLPFDNDTPEGRYYCRTVRIDVQTPRD